MRMLGFAALCVIAYCVGSLSTAVLVCKWMKLPDPRTQGSGNPGATNMLRLNGKKLALIVLIGDVLKGVIPVGIAVCAKATPLQVGCMGIAVFLGHLYPVFFHFRGGKGVATAWGVLLAISWPLGIAAAGTWLMLFLMFRYSSLAALVTAMLTPFYSFYVMHSLDYVVMVTLISLLLCWRHRKNIRQLREGTEKPFKS